MDDDGTLGLGAEAMADDAIDELLYEAGFGVLSLADGGSAYPVPLSFGYDGDRCYFGFLRAAEGSASVKRRYGEATERAAFLVYDVRSKYAWRSAIAFGPLSVLPEADHGAAEGAHRDNGWHTNLWTSPGPMRELEWWALEVAEATGRRATAAGDPGGD